MNAYLYRGVWLCERCAKEVKAVLSKNDDSDFYPVGPFSDGGGEADAPQHCDKCDLFLENPLTDEGIEYVREALADGEGACLAEWEEFYKHELE